jgi:hypothetical protein
MKLIMVFWGSNHPQRSGKIRRFRDPSEFNKGSLVREEGAFLHPYFEMHRT